MQIFTASRNWSIKFAAVVVVKDFYSHSNWVELGNSAPYDALVRSDQPLDNLAGQTLVSSVPKSAAWHRFEHTSLKAAHETCRRCICAVILLGAAFTAGRNTPTCRNCEGDRCEDNVRPELQQQGLITSGYFSLISSAKPAGNSKTAVRCCFSTKHNQKQTRPPPAGRQMQPRRVF